MDSYRDLQADQWIEFCAYAGVALAGFLIGSLVVELLVPGIVESAFEGLKARLG